MARREWIKISQYNRFSPPLEGSDHIILGVFTALIVPLGIEIQCIRHCRYPGGDVFMLPAYRSTALAEHDFPPQSFFRIRGKHKALRFQLLLEEALIRDALPGPLVLPKECMPKIPSATRKAALQGPVQQTSLEKSARHFIQRNKNHN